MGDDLGMVEDLLKAEVSHGDAAMARTETKTSILLAIFSPLCAVGLAVLPRASAPVAALVAFWAALGLLVLALLVLLWNVRPRLHGSGFATYESMSDTELAAYFARVAEDPARLYRERLLVIARLGTKKFKMLRTATTLITAALFLAIIAAVASIL